MNQRIDILGEKSSWAQVEADVRKAFLDLRAATSQLDLTRKNLLVLFCAFDGIMKVIKEPHVIAASAELGFSGNVFALIGILLLACTALYAIPRTAILGAVLLTGYLGGAVVSNVRVGHPVFECIFPIIFGALSWVGIFLREPRLRALIPVRN